MLFRKRVGFCLAGIFSWWDFVQVGFCPSGIFSVPHTIYYLLRNKEKTTYLAYMYSYKHETPWDLLLELDNNLNLISH